MKKTPICSRNTLVEYKLVTYLTDAYGLQQNLLWHIKDKMMKSKLYGEGMRSMHQEFKKTHKWNLADTVTAVRMAASFILLFYPMKSIWFLVIYTFAGLTDVLDGWLARKSGRASEFGARLDSISDLLFYSVLLIRLFPVLYRILPGEIWYAVLGIVFVRLAAYITAAVKYHRFASLHTWLNKLTGVAVFLLPYVLSTSAIVVYSWAVCIFAFASSAEELAIHLLSADYLADRKSLMQRK